MKRFAILFFGILCLTLAGGNYDVKKMYRVEHAGDNYFDGKIPTDFFDKIASGDFNRNIYHKFSDRKAWKNARKSKYADMIIKKADAVKAGKVPQLLFSEFRRFAVDGDRVGYQNLYYKRRADMGYLALALCLTGDKEKYMPRLLDHALAITEEFTWCIPAHSHWVKNTYMNREPVDLFAAETGAVMAILCHILGDELDKEIEGFSEKIRKMALQRVVYNTFYDPETSETNGWYITSNPVNWTPWCSYNVLITAILLEKDDVCNGGICVGDQLGKSAVHIRGDQQGQPEHRDQPKGIAPEPFPGELILVHPDSESPVWVGYSQFSLSA